MVQKDQKIPVLLTYRHNNGFVAYTTTTATSALRTLASRTRRAAPRNRFHTTMADSASNKVLRFLIARDIVKGKSREDLMAKLEAAGFSGEHADLFIAQAERRVLARNRRCAIISAIVVAILLSRVIWGPYANHPDMQLLMGILAAIFAAAGFYFWFVARWQAPLPKAVASA